MKMLITGGHLTPALALIDYIQEKHPEDSILFCGRLYTQGATKQASHEVDEISRRGIQFIPFSAPKVGFNHQWWHWFSLSLQLVIATGKALGILIQHRPQVFVSFGGYVALPMALACAIAGISIVTHEQTRVAGSANRFIGKLATKVAVSYPESLKYFTARKTVVTGNPLRRQLFKTHPKPEWMPSSPTKPLLYITGGNQGSAVLNLIVQRSLKALLKNWTVIHQCGSPTTKQNYLAELTKTKNQLSAGLKESYIVCEWVTDAELGWMYHHVTSVVSRAGANTIAELTAHGIPSVFVPLPFAHYDEQTINAEAVEKIGGAIVIAQKNLTTTSLIHALDKIRRYRRSMSAKLKALQIQTDADQQLYELIKLVVSKA